MLDPEVKRLHVLAEAAVFAVGHPKLAAVSPAAAWLWLQGLVYARSAPAPSGAAVIIPVAMVRAWKGTKLAESLVAVGLWGVMEGGWRMRRLDAAAPAPAMKAPPPPPAEVVLRFEPIGGSWFLTKTQVAEWQATFTGVDVLAECRHAKVWMEASPSHRKTRTGMASFLVRWLGRAQNRRPAGVAVPVTGRGRTGPAPQGKYQGLQEKS